MLRASTAIQLLLVGSVTTVWAVEKSRQQQQWSRNNYTYPNSNTGGYPSTQPSGSYHRGGRVGWCGPNFYYWGGARSYIGSIYDYERIFSGGRYNGGYGGGYGGGFGGGYDAAADHGGFAHSSSISHGGFGSIGHAMGAHG